MLRRTFEEPLNFTIHFDISIISLLVIILHLYLCGLQILDLDSVSQSIYCLYRSYITRLNPSHRKSFAILSYAHNVCMCLCMLKARNISMYLYIHIEAP